MSVYEHMRTHAEAVREGNENPTFSLAHYFVMVDDARRKAEAERDLLRHWINTVGRDCPSGNTIDVFLGIEHD